MVLVLGNYNNPEKKKKKIEQKTCLFYWKVWTCVIYKLQNKETFSLTVSDSHIYPLFLPICPSQMTQHWEKLLAWVVNDLLHNMTFIKAQYYILNSSPARKRQTCQCVHPIVSQLTHLSIVLQGFVYPAPQLSTSTHKTKRTAGLPSHSDDLI